jgi:Fe2+ or Zn2+ uptake regulation protein
VTHQRQVIYQALIGMHDHPSPEAVYEQVRADIPSISLATVYKTIHTFLEAGLIQEVSIHHGTLRIEANREPHHHLICSECRAVSDLDEALISPIRIKGKLPKGFEVRKFTLDVIGLCAGCRAKAKKQ